MADNITITPGAGATVSTKDIGSGVEVQRVLITDETGVVDMHLAEDDTVALLKRIVKLLESNATVDSANRQRIAVETMPTVAISGTTSVALGGQGPTSAAPAIPTTVVYQPVWEGPVDQRWRVIDDARTAYNNGIRAYLTFT